MSPCLRLAVGLVTLASAFGASCQYPRDPENTLDHVQGGVMRVGVVDNPPWVILGANEPRGVEPELLRQFAAEQDAEIEWVEGPESELVAAMEGFQLDILVGGLTFDSPWREKVALTVPYVDTEIEFGVPQGQELPPLEGADIWVEENSEAAALLQSEEQAANPIHYTELSQVDGPVLTDNYYIDALGYERAGQIQRDDDHVMAVPLGENAFMVELEDFLLDRTETAEAILREEAEKEAR
jgi:polar amino acid transport system substrate-binding protein